MKEIELEITLDKSEKTYASGQKITGELKAVIHEEWQCDALELFLGVNGFSESKEKAQNFKLKITDDRVKKLLYQGQWNPGRYTYPFEIDVPDGPFSYKGSLIELSWYLKAEARPSDGESIRSEIELIIVPGTVIPEGNSREKSAEVVYKESPRGSFGCLLVSLSLFLAGVFAVIKTYQSANDTVMGFAVFFLLLSLVFITFNVYALMVSKRINMAEVRIGSGVVSPGAVIPVNLTFQVNKSIELKEVRATLTGREEAGNVGIRASRKTYRKVLYEKKHELQLPVKQVPAGVPIDVRGEISIPPDAPPSFTLANSLGDGIKLKWIVEVRIEMEKWPDWFYAEEITIRPIYCRTESFFAG